MPHVVGKDMIGGMGFVGLEAGRMYKLGYESRLEYKTAQGASLNLASVDAPFNALSIYGKSTQNGTPTPDAPIPIDSNEGDLRITTCGKNLFDPALLEDDSLFDKSYTSSGFWILKVLVPNEDITISVEKTSNANNSFLAVSADGNNSASKYWFIHGTMVTDSTPLYRTLSKDSHTGSIYLYLGATKDRVDAILPNVGYIQIEVGSTVSDYEPYIAKTITISIPNGLPGIPVSSGGNYTDSDSRQWVCDEIDFKRGKYIQRVWRKMFDGSESWGLYNTSLYLGFNISILPEAMQAREGYCSAMRVHGISSSYHDVICFGANNTTIYLPLNSFRDDTLDDSGLSNWKAYLQENPMTVMTYLTNPIERELAPEEVAAYKALHTYSPSTVVMNDAGVWMKVGYKAIP